MNGEYLLDTNIIIALFASDAAVIVHLRAADEVYIPVIAVGELYYGAYKSRRINDNLGRIDEFILRNTAIACDASTARYYGKLKNELRQLGQPIPENDIWIAALAMQHNLVLASRDRHFEAIPDLTLTTW